MKSSVSVSFHAVPSIQDWERIKVDVERQLPLTNLHWKSSSRTIRTIQSLALNFQPIATLSLQDNPATSSTSSSRLSDRPYLHLLFVSCDDNDIYRATVRTQIRDWLDQIVARPNQEWLIVHISGGRTPGAKFYQRKGTVVEKIRADFNTGKRDRCVQVAQFLPAEDPTSWADFTTRAKEAIITTFDTNIGLYEEDVRKADSQRQLPGWSFCSFFCQKEALADCFESMNLYEDALMQYDELEASFFQSAKDNNLIGFTNFGGMDVGDDSSSIVILSSAKPYRELIGSGTISIFDFRVYLFTRQASLLLAVGRIADLAKRGSMFISTFARALRENQTILGRYFLESWTYSSCLHVVEECERWLEQHPSIKSDGFTAVKAELLELARKQLDKVGIAAGHLPSAHPFSMGLNEYRSVLDASVAARVSRVDLVQAIADQDVFDKLYIDATNRSIQAYKLARRKRCAFKLDASLAALEEHRQRYPSAQKLYARLPSHYVEHRWSKIESLLLRRAVQLQEQLDLPKERLLSTLALVRAGIEFGSRSWSLNPLKDADNPLASSHEDNTELAARLMADVHHLSSLLTKDYAALAFPTFSIRMASNRGAIEAVQDGVSVTVIVTSLLPCLIDVDELRLKFSTVHEEQVWFTSQPISVMPGETTVTLFSPTAVTGCLTLQLSQIRFSRIIFQYSYRPISDRNLAPDLRYTPLTEEQPLVYFPRDHQALDISLELPTSIRLDEDRQVIVCIATGRNEIISVSINLSTDMMDARFDFARASLHETQTQGARLTCHSDTQRLLVENLPASSMIKLRLPILGVLLDAAIDISVVAEYFTIKRPTTRRTFRRLAHYPVALPLVVTVQDFFRKDCLLSKFSIATDGFNPLRIRSASLEGNEEIEVRPCRSSTAKVTISAPQIAHFLFKISKKTLSTSDLPLELTLQYRPIRDEFLAVVKTIVLASLLTASLEASLLWFTVHVVAAVEGSTNLDWFGVSDGLDHLAFDETHWTKLVDENFGANHERLRVMKVLGSIYDSLRMVSMKDVPDNWRTLIIPVELPSLSILNLVHLSTSSTRVEIGQPIAASLSIQPSYSWSSTSPPSQSISLVYDVVGSYDDWIISGRKRGEFVAEDGNEFTVSLTLIPLRSGTLFLPSITVRPLDLPIQPLSCETENTKAATAVIVLPVTDRQSTFSINTALGSRTVYAS